MSAIFCMDGKVNDESPSFYVVLLRKDYEYNFSYKMKMQFIIDLK